MTSDHWQGLPMRSVTAFGSSIVFPILQHWYSIAVVGHADSRCYLIFRRGKIQQFLLNPWNPYLVLLTRESGFYEALNSSSDPIDAENACGRGRGLRVPPATPRMATQLPAGSF